MKALAIGTIGLLSLAACGGGGSPVIPASPVSTNVAPSTSGIAFVGDSITAGSRLPDNPNGITDPHSLSPTAYPFLVGAALNERVQNLGIGGEMVGQAVTDEVPQINPLSRVVVIYLGTNNVTYGNPQNPIVSTAESDMLTLLTAVKARAPRACITLITLPHDIYEPQVVANQDQYDGFLLGLGYPTLDLRTQVWTRDPTNYIADGIHPDATGNALLAQSVEAFLHASC